MVSHKVQLAALLVVSLIAFAKAGCGCLKCSKNLKVVSPPNSPIQIIYRGEKSSCHQKRLLPYSVQIPLPCVQKLPPQVPVPNCGCASPVPAKLDNLYAIPDRIVMPAPDLVVPPPVIGPMFNPLEIDMLPPQPLPKVDFGLPPPPLVKPCGCRYGSALPKRRIKRALSPTQTFFHITQFLPAFLRVPLQKTFRIFLEDTLLKHTYNADTNNEGLTHTKPFHESQDLRYTFLEDGTKTNNVLGEDFDKSIFLKKLRLLNNDQHRGRSKREITEITLPFYQIDFDGDGSISSYEDDEENLSVPSSDEIVGGARRNNLLKPFHLSQMIPHSPLFYFLNAPIRLIHHLHNLKKHFNPLLKALPKVLFTSKKYFKNFGNNIQGHLLNIASNLMGDFSNVKNAPKLINAFMPNRFKRAIVENSPVIVVKETDQNQKIVIDKKPDIAFLEQTEVVPLKELDPNLALSNFYGVPEEPPKNTRAKRFIMKVVDEDEVQEFLREKLEDLEEPQPIEPPTKDTKKIKIKPLTSKIIIDDNGRSFMELNGMKRPLFNRPRKELTINKVVGRNFGKHNEDQDVKMQITNLIKQAKTMSNQNTVGAPYNSEMHVQIIKDKITQILGTIQDLINYDFGRFVQIQDDLLKLQALKESVVEDWKNILIEGGGKNMGDKIRILNAIRDLQGAKDVVLAKVAGSLKNTQNYMGKKYVKILIRLQKLQCIIYKTLEDFEEKIKLGNELEVSEEIKRIDSLEAITFTTSSKKEQIVDEIKSSRDEELQKQIELLEDLQKLLEIRTTTENKDVINKINEAARLIWETKNIHRLQKDSIKALNEKLTKCQKLRKELKILFDLQKQLEEVEEKQNGVIEEIVNKKNTIKRPKRVKTPQKTARSVDALKLRAKSAKPRSLIK